MLSDNCKNILIFLQDNEETEEWTGKDLEDKTGIRGIPSVMNSLFKNGYVEKGETLRNFTNNKGITMKKIYITYKLTDQGKAYREDD